MEDVVLKRDKKIAVYATEAAEWDIVNGSVSSSQLQVIAQNLAQMPISERDVPVCSVRYRDFGD